MFLDQLIKVAQALQISDKQASEIENCSITTTALAKHKQKPKQYERQYKSNALAQRNNSPSNMSVNTNLKSIAYRKKVKCRYCGLDYPHQMPADSKTCNYLSQQQPFWTSVSFKATR